MPSGLGKTKIVAIFVPDSHKEIAQKAGADIIGTESLIKNVW